MASQVTQKPVYKLIHKFKSKFVYVGLAFWSKYLEQHMYDTITLVDVQQLSADEFMFVRRHESGSGQIEYERIYINRKTHYIEADANAKLKGADRLAERCIYKGHPILNEVDYQVLIFAQLWPRPARQALFHWGTSRMNNLIESLKKEFPAL